MRSLCESEQPPGVLAYDGNNVVGWAAVAPRSETQYARSRTIPVIDDLPVWSAWCFRVRPGHRGTGVLDHVLRGAVEFARENGAPAIEGYPVDNAGAKVDQTMAFVGFRAMFERAGFSEVSETSSVSGGFPRVLMRRDLR
ncbi:GNAT superfamily N-acetyltransferase [Microbacterium amylolyticum]|uniref:GNAT superfamily N-acetyltransferase n=1 Tax=Microbacterium amylolyticum TaxID=936337 RepID=A0ABS4ZFC6_9MICO|nr:GNAT superfamily N-acetyltransferase [Microbacterium amylolyticum]